jgi:hypothetical protein
MARKVTVYTHAFCSDGTHALKIFDMKVRSRLDAELIYIPIKHDTPYPLAEEGEVWYLDICPVEEIMTRLDANPKITHVTILDHHKIEHRLKHLKTLQSAKFHVVHDISRSGALITLESDICSHLGITAPINGWNLVRQIASYVSDRDLFTFHLPESKSVNNFLFVEYDPVGNTNHVQEDLAALDELYEGKFSIDDMKRLGTVYAECAEAIIQSEMPAVALGTFILPSGKTIRCGMSKQRFLRSDIGNRTMKKYPDQVDCALSYVLDPITKRYWLSFRSDSKHEDVALICREFGGNGHRDAAGCEVSQQYFENNIKFWTPHPDPEPIIYPNMEGVDRYRNVFIRRTARAAVFGAYGNMDIAILFQRIHFDEVAESLLKSKPELAAVVLCDYDSVTGIVNAKFILRDTEPVTQQHVYDEFRFKQAATEAFA